MLILDKYFTKTSFIFPRNTSISYTYTETGHVKLENKINKQIDRFESLKL